MFASFFDYVKKQDHWYIVVFFKIEEDAKKLENKIKSMDAKPFRNDIPSYKEKMTEDLECL